MPKTPGPWNAVPCVAPFMLGGDYWAVGNREMTEGVVALVLGRPKDLENLGIVLAAPELYDLLQESLAVVSDELESLIASHTLQSPEGKPDMHTLDENARPTVEAWESLLARGRRAMAKAEGVTNAG